MSIVSHGFVGNREKGKMGCNGCCSNLKIRVNLVGAF